MNKVPSGLYPVAVLQDRYGGTYSRGAWVAIARWYKEHGRAMNRLDAVAAIIHGDDLTAAAFDHEFGDEPWVAVGDTPEQAIERLAGKPQPERDGPTDI